ncbi:MAG TPA: F0F1 ATP synthase subunit A [Pyrinomonadaceae bacterium]|jgi:F-type H+-transporting ATPase subunit a
MMFAEGAEGGGHHTPVLVQFVNYYLGEPAYHFQMQYTRPLWTRFLANFGTTPDAAFGALTPENAIPWYTIMFVVACLLTFGLIWVLKGKLSEDDPSNGQQTLEATVLGIRQLLIDVVGPQGVKYFPVVATFALLILVSNVMGLFPLFMAPTAATSVTFALGITSFLYYNYIGIKENGLLSHLGHLAGPIWWMAWLIFPIELIGNFIRPFSLGVRLFGNMFADEQVAATIAGLAGMLGLPPYLTQFLVPIPLMVLGLFVALVQAFVFTLLSMVYLGEVSHAPHEEHHQAEATGHNEPHIEHDTVIAPA